MTDVPQTMTGMQLIGQGGYDKLVLRHDLPVPEPQAGDVLIGVLAAGVNNTEINHRLAWYAQGDPGGSDGEPKSGHLAKGVWAGSTGPRFPLIQGADVCGRIVAVGAGVDAARIGERVIVDPLQRDPPRYLGGDCDGGFAQYVRVPAVNAYRIDSVALSDIELASLPCSYSTAENLLTRTGVRAGERLLVTGASGGVGSAVVQLARLRGAQVTAVTVPSKADQLRALGADRIVDRNSPVAETLGSNSVDVVIDLVGGPKWPELLNVLVSGGRYGVSGAIAGPIVLLDLRTFYFKDLTFFGCTSFPPTVFANLVRHIESGELKPPIAGVYPLSRMADAQEAFLKKEHVGKLVLTI